MRQYVGTIAENGDRIVTVDGQPLPPRHDVANHSPTGFAWGYPGSGPSQLALALCMNALDGDIDRAHGIYQWFKWRIIAHLNEERGWELTQGFILDTIAALEAEKAERADTPPTTKAPF